MKLLCELLNEIWGSGRQLGDEMAWRDQAAARSAQMATPQAMEFWIVSPDKKKYGPFASAERAKQFFASRTDIHRGSQLKSAPKGGRL